MRLLGVELSRLVARRAAVVLVLLGAIAIGGIVAGLLYNERPVSAAELAQAQQYADETNQSPYVQRHYTKCLDRGESEETCASMWLTQADDMVYRTQLDVTEYKGWMLPMGGLSAAVALLIGATFIGGDIASGSVGTQLLFQPSRWKVWAAKTAAVGIGTGVATAVVLGAANATIWLFAKGWDRPIPAGLGSEYLGSVARATVFAAAAGIVGFALALIARHTAAALGVLAVYGIAAETVLRLVWPGSERWLLSNHVAAFIAGPFNRRLYTDCDGFGPCEVTKIHFTLPFTSTYLLVGLVAVSAVAMLMFQRRDVP